MRWKAPVVALAAATLALAACSTEESNTAGVDATATPEVSGQETPSSDGLVVYSGRSEELVGPLLAEFTTQTGIPVQVRYGDSAELAAQLIEEGDRSPADIYFGQDAGALGALDAAGLCAPLPENLIGAVPAQYQSANGTWTGITGRARVIAYDPQQVPAEEVPTSVLELTDPRWQGQVAIAPTNASFQAFVTGMRVALGDEATQQWLQAMVDNDVQVYEKNGLIRDAVDAGEVQLGLINHYYWYEKAAEVGEDAMNVQIAFPAAGDPGALVNVAGACVLPTAAHAEDANEMLTWMLLPETQEWFVSQTFEYPLVAGVPAPEGLPALDSLQGADISLAQLEDLPGTLAMLQEVGLT